MRVVVSVKTQILHEIMRRHALGVEITYDFLVDYFAKDAAAARTAVFQLIRDGYISGESEEEIRRMVMAGMPVLYP